MAGACVINPSMLKVIIAYRRFDCIPARKAKMLKRLKITLSSIKAKLIKLSEWLSLVGASL